VNIPAYELQAVSAGRLELVSRVVVGKPATPTPEVSTSVRAVNLLPYWHVPQSIANRALIPAVKKDPQYLAKEQFRVFLSWGGREIDPANVNWWAPQAKQYVFRQNPGPFNALGLIRLDMPNRHIVYLHDTPLKELFGYHLRPYSAGCVRVERIQQLSAWLLRGEAGWDQSRLEQAIRAGKQQTITLAQPVPVHFVYLSAWATGQGVAHFRMDIYDKDGEGLNAEQSVSWETATQRVAP
jgi:murein L,D-transpeptidase YcbB/YkuD